MAEIPEPCSFKGLATSGQAQQTLIRARAYRRLSDARYYTALVGVAHGNLDRTDSVPLCSKMRNYRQSGLDARGCKPTFVQAVELSHVTSIES